MVPQILETPLLLLSPSRPLIQNPTLTHHCMMAHAPCSSEQFAVNEVAYYNGAVCGTLAGPEKSLGLFWQARLLAYNVVVSSLGNEESAEGVAVPLSAQQHMDVLGGVSIDPSALSVAASLQGFGVVTTVTGAQPRAPRFVSFPKRHP